MDGSEQLICCTVNGEIKGFKPKISETGALTIDMNLNQDTVRDLSQRKKVILKPKHIQIM